MRFIFLACQGFIGGVSAYHLVFVGTSLRCTAQQLPILILLFHLQILFLAVFGYFFLKETISSSYLSYQLVLAITGVSD